ncbi:unnamed protein product [Anisakis simplex]|uniref:Chromosome 1 open reading frame 9 (inferred by orthology to a human protein) n=1 Tax=Anisakis simplex TaxID=6269 RepID=A0A158PN12_ANISI|nr:unnamed protein product [Anisakis simplex]
MKNQQKALENGSNKMKVNLNENKMALNEVSSNINNMRQEAATQRNYASRDCGAKVLFSNDEAENRNAVLNEKERDDYMRNPCGRAHNKWFIIELCETISLTAIELANFELFSSGPERVRISLSERYPTNEWNVLDEITAADSRDIQRFPINANGYAKFIRIELLTHHGNEHYCTLSMVRIFGISMVDEYEYEAQADADSMPEVVHNQIDVENDSKEVESEKQNDVINKQSDGAALKIARNKSEIQTKLNDSKDEQIALMDVMVNAVNKIAIKNIKIAFQSAFLGGWRSDTGEVVMNAGPLKQQCATCPLPADSSLKAMLFCRTFFAYGFSDSNNSTFIDNKPSSQISNYQSLPGVSLSHKESIFLKLNKRINALELNMSLSSEYLSELSRRYVKQLNESRLYSDRLLKSVENVTQNTLRNAKQKFDKQITEIKREMKQLSLMVKTLWSNFKTFECPLSTTSTVNNNDDNQISSSSSVQKHLGHVPYPNGYLWTIEQLIILIVISQICAIFVVLLLERCYRHYAYWNKSTLNNVIDERFELLFKSYSTRQDGVEEYRECMCSNDNLKSSQTVTSEPNYALKKIKLESSDIIDGIYPLIEIIVLDSYCIEAVGRYSADREIFEIFLCEVQVQSFD